MFLNLQLRLWVPAFAGTNGVLFSGNNKIKVASSWVRT